MINPARTLRYAQSARLTRALGLVLAGLATACAGTFDETDNPDGAPTAWDGAASPDGGLSADGAQPDASPGDGGAALPTPEHLVIVGWDGVQRDHFKQCLRRKLPACSQGLPHFSALTKGKLFHLTVTTAATCTKPGWVELLTGRDATTLGIEDNKIFKPIPAGISVLERLQAHLGASSVSIFLAGKASHTGGDCTTKPREPWCKVKANLDHFETDLQDNANVGQRALALLDKHKGRRIVAFFHFWNPDHTGHKQGEGTSAYSKQLVNLDGWLGKIVARLKAHGILDRTLVYVVTDHGFDEGKTSHLNAPYGIMGANDPLVTRHGDRKDPAPTILVRFGLAPGKLQGVALNRVPKGCVPEGKAALDYAGAPACCAGLTPIGLHRLSSKDLTSCLPPTGGSGDRTRFCTRCGDGICRAPENRCNCKTDCKM